MSLPWFRMYSEFSGDPVIQSLAFEDQRHFVILLCLKCNGTLDRDIQDHNRERIILRGLGLDQIAASEAKRRLMEVGIIDSSWQPSGWGKRQFVSDVSTDRVRKYRNSKEDGNVSETLLKRTRYRTDTEQNRTDKSIVALPRDDTQKENKNTPLTAQAIEVLDFLNTKTGKKFRALDGHGKPTAALRAVIDRLKTGVSVQDCKTMIARKHREWSGNDMAIYLRPSTLFRASNFENYLGECVAK